MKVFKQIILPVLFVIAVGLIVVGIINEGYYDVLNKAKMICFECIGIG